MSAFKMYVYMSVYNGFVCLYMPVEYMYVYQMSISMYTRGLCLCIQGCLFMYTRSMYVCMLGGLYVCIQGVCMSVY